MNFKIKEFSGRFLIKLKDFIEGLILIYMLGGVVIVGGVPIH